MEESKAPVGGSPSPDFAEIKTPSSELLARVFRSSPESITVSRLRDGVFLEVNESFERISGYRRDEVIGRSSLDLSIWAETPEDRVGFAEELRAKGSVRDFPATIRTKSGELRSILLSAETFDHDGETCVVTIGRDVTRQEQVERALQLTQTAVDRASDAVFWVQEDAHFGYVNEEACRSLEYTREELLALTVLDIDPTHSLEACQREWDELRTCKNKLIEGVHRSKSGREFPVEIRINYIQFAGKEYLFAFARDITERKRAEKELRASEEKYRSLVTNIPCVTWTSDRNGTTTFVSPNIESIYGYTPEEIYQGGADLWLGRIHPDDVDRVKSAYTALLDNGAPFDVEYRIRTKSGDLIWLNDRATRTYDDQGVVRADGVFSDITARKEAEAARQQAEYQYRHIFESAADGLAILTIEGQFVEVNPAMCDLHGFTREEFRSLTPMQFIAPAYVARFDELRGWIEQGEDFYLEVQGVHKDGRIIDLGIRGTVFQYRGKTHALAAVRDITERKQGETRLRLVTEQLVEANAALEEKNAALRQILEHLEHDKKAYRHEVCDAVEKLLLPVVARLKESEGTLDRQDIDVLETTLTAIVERDIDQFKSDLARLTPRELDICELIREGGSSKEIATKLNISSQTVHKHRQLIRRKLRLSNKAVNLAAYLRSR